MLFSLVAHILKRESFTASTSYWKNAKAQRPDFYEYTVNSLYVIASLVLLAIYLFHRDQATEKKAQRDWHKLDSEFCCVCDFLSKRIILDNRHQPPSPVNQSLNDLLDLVQDSTDPWLLFLWVQQFSFVLYLVVNHFVILIARRYSSPGYRGEKKQSKVRCCPLLDLNGTGLLGRCWVAASEMEKRLFRISPAQLVLTTSTALLSSAADSIIIRPSAGPVIPNKDPKRTSQSIRQWTASVW